MKTNDAGRKIIIDSESVRLEAYPDPGSLRGRELAKPLAERSPNISCYPGDPWTIGVGATGPGIGPGLVWTSDQVWARFERDLARFEWYVAKLVRVPINENQFSALVSFTFNEGPGHLANSDLLHKLNRKDYAGAAAEFQKWEYSSGRRVEGLRTRRLAEQTLFLTPVAQVA